MVKLVHVITSLSRGGAQSMLLKLAQELHKTKEFDQEVVSLIDHCDYYNELSSIGIKIHVLNTTNNPFSPIFELRKKIKELSPDIIQSWMYHANFAIFFSGISKDKIVFNVRHSLHDIRLEKFVTRLMINIGSILSRFVFSTDYCSKTSINQHLNINYSLDYKYIPNGFDIKKYKPNAKYRKDVRKSVDINNSTLLIGSVARYHPMKNHIGLIQEFSKFLEKNNNSHLMLVGSGLINNKKINNSIKSMGICSKITIFDDRNDVYRLMNAMDVFVISSLWGEAFPNVLGEAMLTEIPCIVTNVGDSKYIVGSCGTVADSGIYKALCDIDNMSYSERRLVGHNLRQRAVKNFSIEFVSSKYRDMYKEMLHL